MNKEKSDFLEVGCPFIIVRKLIKEVIEQATKAYWLKLYHFSRRIDISTLDTLKDEFLEELKELDELDNS